MIKPFYPNRCISSLLCLIIVLFIGPMETGYAQTASCSNGTMIEVEGGYTLDWEALCEAAQPWSDKGIQVVIYLSNFRPETEDDWYDHLDAAEVALGLISADRTVDNFTPNVLAIEATTGASRNFGTTITFGQALYNTPLDTDTAVSTIKADMLDDLQRERYTDAFVTALAESYAVNYPPPTFGDYLVNIAIAGLGVLVVLAVLNRFFGNRIREWWRLRQNKQVLGKRIEDVQIAFSNLVSVLNGFIEAPTPEESLLYRIYFAAGADKYEDLLETAVARLKESQENLRQIKSDYAQIPQPEDNALEKQLNHLQAVYLRLIGTLADQHNLTDEAIRKEFDIFFTESTAAYQEELDSLKTTLQNPLTFTFNTKPKTTTPIGIMDDVLAFQTELDRLRKAQKQAPTAIESIRQRMADMEPDLPKLEVAFKDLFSPIHVLLQTATEQLENGRYLDVAPIIAEANNGLDLLNELSAIWETHLSRQQKIVDAGAEGFHPPILMTLENELTFTVAPLLESFKKGDYDEAQALLIEFELNSEYALEETIEWQSVHQNNIDQFTKAEMMMARLQKYQTEKSIPAWDILTKYTPSNWRDLEETESDTAVSLQRIESQLTQCKTLNAIENDVQQFDAADAKLTVLLAQLAHLEFQLETIVYRLEEVQAAESSLEKAIQLTNTELKQVISLRDAEDEKISPSVDNQIEQAQAALKNAETFITEQNFRSAIVAQSHVRQLARQAHSTATTEVDKINKLLVQMNELQAHVDELAAHVLQTAQKMHDVVLTTAVSKSAKEAEAQWSLAQIMASKTANKEDQAWADALEKAIIAYQVAETATQSCHKQNEAAKQAYDQLMDKAVRAKEKAQSAISNAERARQKSGVGSAGENALQQAKTTLNALPAVAGWPTKESLNRIIREAKHVEKSAQSAAKLARDAHRKYQARQRTSHSTSSWGSSSSSSRSSWSSSSSRSSRSSFSSSRSSSRSSGSTSSRRRR